MYILAPFNENDLQDILEKYVRPLCITNIHQPFVYPSRLGKAYHAAKIKFDKKQQAGIGSEGLASDCFRIPSHLKT